MSKKRVIKFREAGSSITEPITKFGGQPIWIEKPEWPVSRSTGQPMRFICQIVLEADIFGSLEGRIAYIFMTDDEEYVDGTWDPDSGENIVIIQPNINSNSILSIKIGPSLYKMEKVESGQTLHPVSREFFVEKSEIKEDTQNFEEEEFENKIGGEPDFLQSEEYPDNNRENWKLLLQLDSSSVPFEINFGDAGVGYAFISNDGNIGKFLWQCH